jgi:hypothetical protein
MAGEDEDGGTSKNTAEVAIRATTETDSMISVVP